MFDTGYLLHCLGVYLLGLVAVIMFTLFNCPYNRNGKDVLLGFLGLLLIYSIIFVVIVIAVPLLNINH